MATKQPPTPPTKRPNNTTKNKKTPAKNTTKTPPKPPTNPDDYTESDHYKQRLQQQGRYITKTEVNQLIRNGNWHYDNHNWNITATITGLQYTAIINPDKNEIVTAYIAITNKQHAHTNPHYTTQQINTMHTRTLLAWNPQQLTNNYYNNIIINKPFHLREHQVHTPHGHNTLTCTKCNYQAKHKNQYATQDCVTTTNTQ